MLVMNAEAAVIEDVVTRNPEVDLVLLLVVIEDAMNLNPEADLALLLAVREGKMN
jgi:hypothetical protein